MGPHLIASRLRPPHPLLELVRREQLLRRLSAAEAPLVVLSAPGGYGKTVTLSQWAGSDGVPFAWLQADVADNDPLVFLQYLTAALTAVIDVDPRVAGWLRLAPPPVEARILPALAGAVAAAGPFVLVIDDAHLVSSEVCWRIVAVLLDQLPPEARLCLSGRTPPPLPLARLRAEGRVLELGPHHLALDRDEIGELFRLHRMPADAEAVTYLRWVTEGWPAGLYLAALAGDELSPRDLVLDVRGDRRDVARYLATEVLEKQPADLVEFLLQTSILERLSPSLCRAVTGDERAGDRLHDVARHHLFISSLDDTDEWYRYHHLFAAFLQAELVRRRSEDEAAALHRRAAAWFEEHGALEEAVRHWLAGGDPSRAGAIVCRQIMGFCVRWDTLRRWLEMFTDEQILADPLLCVAAGWAGPPTGESPRVRIWLGAALHADVGDAVWPGVKLPALAVQAGLRAMTAMDGVAEMRRDAELAIALTGDEDSALHCATLVNLGLSLWLTRDIQGALAVLTETNAHAGAVSVLAEVASRGTTVLILADLGRWEEAAEQADVASRRVEEMGLGWALPTLPVLWARARVGTRVGSDTAADVTVITDIVEKGLPPLLTLITDVVVGELHFEKGDPAEATRWMRAGLSRLATWPDAGILRERLERLKRRLEERHLLEPLTPAEVRVLELLPTELSQQDIAERLFVSRETVRSHTRDIYRKLGVHTRTEAVARARETGLLATT